MIWASSKRPREGVAEGEDVGIACLGATGQGAAEDGAELARELWAGWRLTEGERVFVEEPGQHLGGGAGWAVNHIAGEQEVEGGGGGVLVGGGRGGAEVERLLGGHEAESAAG